jgi:hypothetical protein
VTAPQVTRVAKRRGAFGLDDRRRPDPARVEAGLRDLLARVLPEVWPLPTAGEDESSGRTLTLILPRGHVAVLRIERDPDHPGPACRDLVARCDALHIPQAIVSSVEEGRAALRRLGVEPPPQRVTRDAPTLRSVFGSA